MQRLFTGYTCKKIKCICLEPRLDPRARHRSVWQCLPACSQVAPTSVVFICFWSSLVSIDEVPIGSEDRDQVSSCLWLVLACSSCDCHDLCFFARASDPLWVSGFVSSADSANCKQRYRNTCLLIELFFFGSLECLFLLWLAQLVKVLHGVVSD